MKYITSIANYELIRKSAPEELIRKLERITEYDQRLLFSYNPFSKEEILKNWKTDRNDVKFFYYPDKCQLLLKAERLPEFEDDIREGVGSMFFNDVITASDKERATCYVRAVYDFDTHKVNTFVCVYSVEDNDVLVPLDVPEDLRAYKNECCKREEEQRQKESKPKDTFELLDSINRQLRRQSAELRRQRKQLEKLNRKLSRK